MATKANEVLRRLKGNLRKFEELRESGQIKSESRVHVDPGLLGLTIAVLGETHLSGEVSALRARFLMSEMQLIADAEGLTLADVRERAAKALEVAQDLSNGGTTDDQRGG